MNFSEDHVICRFCLKKITENCEPIEEIVQYTVNFLTLCPIFTIGDNPMICQTCALNLRKCFDFKTVCLYTEDCISSFEEGENKNVDLRDIYLKVKLDGNIDRVPDDHSVCHFCLELVRDDASMSVRHDRNLIEILEKYFSEMDLRIIDDVVACTSCYNYLQFHVKFIKDYVSIEDKIDEYCKVEGASNKGQVDLGDVAMFISKSMLNDENINSLFVKEDTEGNIVNTNVDIKVKLEDPMDMDQEKELLADKEVELKNNDSFQHLPASRSDFVQQLTRAKIKDVTTRGILYKCDLCCYKTKDMRYLRRHTLIHKPHLEITTYRCNHCDFKTKWKRSLRRHMLNLKHDSGLTMHKCDLCVYESKCRSSLKRHMLTHKSNSRITTYRCNFCDYEAKEKWMLETHKVIHITFSETTMCKCHLCDYQTRQKSKLKMHMLTHKSSSEVTMYKCDQCDFETKFGSSLHNHKLKHKDVSEVTMRKCEVCQFESKWTSSFNNHLLSQKHQRYSSNMGQK